MKYYHDESIVEADLCQILSGQCSVEDTVLESCTVRTYEEAGLLPYESGVVVRLPDGSEYQLTVTQSRFPA